MPRKITPPEVRFWNHVDTSGECWIWTGATARAGYGTFNAGNGVMVPSHRFAWQLANGPIPDGMHILHRCDNPPCVNPAHLFAGTRSDNMRDMVAKGRYMSGDRHPSVIAPERVPRGERHGNAVVSDAQVLEIRGRYARGDISMRLLGLEYGMSASGIWMIVHGKHRAA